MKRIKICKIDYILNKLKYCMNNKKSYSLIRIGDSGIKFIDSILNNNKKRLNSIILKEGLPVDKIYPIFYLFCKYCSQSDFLDSPHVYFNNKFWSRFTRPDIIQLTKNWNNIYYNSEIINNDNFCNPEINFLSLLIDININFLDLIKNKKIYIITDHEEVGIILKNICDVKIIKIVGWYENLYDNNYKFITKFIRDHANDCDLWLVGAGELGRIFTGMIKQFGGRSWDIGSVIDCWCGKDIPKRLKEYITKFDSLRFKLTKKGNKYKMYL